MSALPPLGMEARDFDLIYCQARQRAEMSNAMRQAAEVLRSRGEGRRFFVAENTRNRFRSAENLTQTATIVATSIAAIALIVGVIGIMIIMLVSVSERSREIGVQRAVGARRSDIAIQFPMEALALGLVGGGAGISAGYVAAKTIAQILQIETDFSPTSAGAEILISPGAGVLSGFAPAHKAAQPAPVEALRLE